MELFDEMVIKGLSPDIFVYASMMNRHFKDGNAGEALKLNKEMIEAGVTPDVIYTYCLIKGLVKNGMLNQT
ncbi:OLC1v1012457C1, partial [Oldenlandia corymbosa var. corymbosa]